MEFTQALFATSETAFRRERLSASLHDRRIARNLIARQRHRARAEAAARHRRLRAA